LTKHGWAIADCGLRIGRENAQSRFGIGIARFGGSSSFHNTWEHYGTDWEKATTHGGYDLRVKNGGVGPRKKACKDWVKAALVQKKQKCKSENSLAGRRVWLPDNCGLRIADCGLALKGEWKANSAALSRAPLRFQQRCQP
jgi:hypothetical protein